MPHKVNCKWIDNVAWCKNKKVKRSLLGLGARCCKEYPPHQEKCPFKEPYPKPKLSPDYPTPPRRK